MSLLNNLRALVRRNVLSDLRLSARLYSEVADDAEETEQKSPVDPAKDRTKVIPLETSMRYLQSKAYKETYGDTAVWVKYRRNHKGGMAPKKTRKSCVRNGLISTGNPCPICRDEYLVLDARNVALLEQFISEHTGQVLTAFKTGLCQKKQKELLVAIEKAWDQGIITFDVPFREYDYSQYQPSIKMV